MNLSIEHRTHYTYDQEVFLEPHHLRFHPAVREHIKLKSFSIEITPTPEGLTQRVDAENNIFHQSWFSGLHKSLLVKSQVKVQIEELNPYYFLREDVDISQQPELAIYLKPLTELSSELQDWIANQKEVFGTDSLTLISGINREISQKWAHTVRYETGIMEPSQCFQADKASCRDLCWMMMAILRHLGIAARFVSGYAFNPSMEKGHELHSWVEAWIPGAGWVGFDPVSGLLCGQYYVPVCTSYHPKNTMPVIGNYRGEGGSTMKTEVRLTVKA